MLAITCNLIQSPLSMKKRIGYKPYATSVISPRKWFLKHLSLRTCLFHSTMGDEENNSQQSKKRAAGREISRDNPGLDDDDEACEEEMGTFKKASEEVLARRKIVKVRRSQTTAASAATPSSNPFASLKLAPSHDSSGTNSVAAASSIASSNPFASLKLAPFPGSSGTDAVATNEAEKLNSKGEVKVDATSEIDGQNNASKTQSEFEAIPDVIKHDGEEGSNQPEALDNKEAVVDKAEEEAKNIVELGTIEKDIKKDPEVQTSENGEKQTDGNEKSEKSGEATHFSSFQQLSSSQNAFSGLGTGFSSSSFLFGSLTKDGSSPASGSSSLFGLKNDSSSSGFGSSSAKTGGTALPLMQEVSVETGEENEKSVFAADSVLYDFVEGTWKERGKGELKVNVSTTGTGKARIIMRTRGNYRLILNASIYPEMKVTNMDKRGVTFACMNSADEGKTGLSTYAVKFKDVSMVEKFRSCVMENKDKIAVAPLKTPENSPDASDK